MNRERQLVLPGFEESPWQLLERRAAKPAFAPGVTGPGRLLRELARRGVDDEALPAAAALVLELDREAQSP